MPLQDKKERQRAQTLDKKNWLLTESVMWLFAEKKTKQDNHSKINERSVSPLKSLIKGPLSHTTANYPTNVLQEACSVVQQCK